MTLFIALVGAHPFDLDGANESDTSMVQSVLHGPDPFEDPRVQSVLSLAADGHAQAHGIGVFHGEFEVRGDVGPRKIIDPQTVETDRWQKGFSFCTSAKPYSANA